MFLKTVKKQSQSRNLKLWDCLKSINLDTHSFKEKPNVK